MTARWSQPAWRNIDVSTVAAAGRSPGTVASAPVSARRDQPGMADERVADPCPAERDHELQADTQPDDEARDDRRRRRRERGAAEAALGLQMNSTFAIV